MSIVVPMLGEFVTRHIPDGTVVKQSQVLAALSMAGLPSTLAGGLSLAEALGRVVKDLAKGGVLHNLRESAGVHRFQIDTKTQDPMTGRVLTTFSTDVILDKATGTITSADPSVEAQARLLVVDAQTAVKTTDLARICMRIVAHCCGGRVFSKGHSSVQFFVLDKHKDCADKLESFLKAIGCSLARVPVVDLSALKGMLAAVAAVSVAPVSVSAPSSTPAVSVSTGGCGVSCVVDAVTDGLMADILDVDAIVQRLRTTTRESTIARECARLLEIADYAETVRDLIGCRVEIIRDHAELARMRLRKLYTSVLDTGGAVAIPASLFEEEVLVEDPPEPIFLANGSVSYREAGSGS